jgi:hypothetical protein
LRKETPLRDFTNGGNINVGGNFFVTDQSQQHKLLIHCTNEELVEEEQFRRGQLAREQNGKLKYTLVAVAGTACIFFIIGLYFWYTGKMERFDLFATTSGFLLAFGSLTFYTTPTQVEKRHKDALQEIHIILRERGVR